MSYFRGKKILITGAASGLGRRMALAMAAQGGRMILWDIDPAGLEKVLKELSAVSAGSTNHIARTCDIADAEAVAAEAEATIEQAGGPDILVNNAGIVNGKPFLECSRQALKRTMDVNTLAHFWTVKAFVPHMIERNSGHVVTVASAGGLIGVARLADYCASKFAAIGFHESMRQEFRQRAPGIATTLICPYYINTGMFAGVRTRFSSLLPIMEEPDAANRIVKAIARRRGRLFMPPLVYTVPLLRALPTRLFDAVADFFGIQASMDHFRGRKP